MRKSDQRKKTWYLSMPQKLLKSKNYALYGLQISLDPKTSSKSSSFWGRRKLKMSRFRHLKRWMMSRMAMSIGQPAITVISALSTLFATFSPTEN